MRQRTLGILGGALLIVGIALAVGGGIAANSVANRNTTAAAPGVHRPGAGFPRRLGPGQPGPFFGGPGPRTARPVSPTSSPSV